jgi:hypothetical protein
MSAQIHSYIELQQQIHDDLRIQHPEWVEPNGNCPTCDSYESRLDERKLSEIRIHRFGYNARSYGCKSAIAPAGDPFPQDNYRPLHSPSKEGLKRTSQVVKKNPTQGQWSCRASDP